MAQGKGGSAKTKGANDDRRCKKAFKKNPGVSEKAHNGKTVDGYSPAAQRRREAIRAGRVKAKEPAA